MVGKKDSLPSRGLPMSRIETIMKVSPDNPVVTKKALFLTGKATELFIQSLAQKSLAEGQRRSQGDKRDAVKYCDLAQVVNSEKKLEFLQDVVPRKMKGREFWEIQSRLQVQNET